MAIIEKVCFWVLLAAVAVGLYVAGWQKLSWKFGAETSLLFVVFVAFALLASRVGATKVAKGRIFFWGGTVILALVMWTTTELVPAFIWVDVVKDAAARARLDATRSYLLILGSVFGASSVARGIQYLADHDLENKRSSPLTETKVSTPSGVGRNPPLGRKTKDVEKSVDRLVTLWTHQNSLLWSRLQTIGVLQIAVIGSWYTLYTATKYRYAGLTSTVGALTGCALFAIVHRDSLWLNHFRERLYEEDSRLLFNQAKPLLGRHIIVGVALVFLCVDVLLVGVTLATRLEWFGLKR